MYEKFEAPEFVKFFAKMSGGNMSSTIPRIYETLPVEFQTARAEQIYFTNRRYVTNAPPLLLLLLPLFLLLFHFLFRFLFSFLRRLVVSPVGK
jgi:hypothetical protein